MNSSQVMISYLILGPKK